MQNPTENERQPDTSSGLSVPDWLADGVAMNAQGQLVIREGPADSAALCRAAKPQTWLEVMAKEYENERKMRDMERDINAREPHRFLPRAIAELEEKAKEAAAMRGDGIAGKVMWGQAQAYRDAIALLQTFFR